MPKQKSEKEILLQSYKDLLENSQGFFAVDGKSINNVTVTDLKKKLKAVGSQYVVVKNTLFKIVLQDKNLPLNTSQFDGQTVIVSYTGDPTEVAKLLKKVQKDSSGLFEARFGYIEGDYVSKDEVMNLADIPSKPELLAKLLGSLNSPVSGFMNAVTGNAKGFVRVISELSTKQ